MSPPRLPCSAYSLLFCSCCLWSLACASRKLDLCSQMTYYDLENSNRTSFMPSLLHFQTWSRDPRNPVVMNYAWSTVGYPTLFISQSNNTKSCSNETFRANLTEYLDTQAFGSLYIAGSESDTAVAVVFRRLIEFNGGKKAKAAGIFNTSEAAVNPSQYLSVYLNDESITWYYDPRHRSITGVGGQLFGSIVFNFVIPEKEGDERISYFPKTQFTVHSTVVDMTLEGFSYNSSLVGKNGRIAIEMVMLKGQAVSKDSTIQTATVDDEYTPSVFRTWEYYFNNGTQAYLQWKPISYQSRDRKSTKAQEANLVFPSGAAVHVLGGEIPRGLGSALFNVSTTLLNGTAFYMVIGTDGDENYLNPSRVTWTAVLGFGRAPTDKISTEVVIIIVVSFGIPALLIFLGSFYVTYKKKPWQSIARGIKRIRRREGYERIN